MDAAKEIAELRKKRDDLEKLLVPGIDAGEKHDIYQRIIAIENNIAQLYPGVVVPPRGPETVWFTKAWWQDTGTELMRGFVMGGVTYVLSRPFLKDHVQRVYASFAAGLWSQWNARQQRAPATREWKPDLSWRPTIPNPSNTAINPKNGMPWGDSPYDGKK